MELPSVDKVAALLLPTFKYNDYCLYSSSSDMIGDHWVSPHDQLGGVLCKCCFQEHCCWLMMEQGLSLLTHSNDTEHC